jgi:cation:H+ antiporter
LIQPSDSTQNTTNALHALWTFPGVVLASFVIAWAAESAQFFMSQALSLAILAWLQTLPEFAVAAVIAWEQKLPLITANFTGSLRLLTGLGWPMIYFTAAISAKNRQFRAMRAELAACRARGEAGGGADGARGLHPEIANRAFLDPVYLDKEHAVEVMALIPPLLYFWVIFFKGTLNLIDSLFLLLCYVAYLIVARNIPPKEEDGTHELPRVTQRVMSLGGWKRPLAVVVLFLAGGAGIMFIARPFLHSMLALAVSLGVSQFLFIQCVAPFLSEFPEKLSAFYWARTVRKAPMAFMNMVSSNINQWTVLVAMLPIVYCVSRGGYSVIVFDSFQKLEILLTMAQAILGFFMLANMEFRAFEAGGLFVLWLVQFVRPEIRLEITIVYFAWIAVEVVMFMTGRRKLTAFRDFADQWKRHSLGKGLVHR